MCKNEKINEFLYLKEFMNFVINIGFSLIYDVNIHRKSKKNQTKYSVLRLFMAQKHDLRLLRAVVRKFVSRLQPPLQKLESLNFGFRRSLGQFR
jgi:uridine kinase